LPSGQILAHPVRAGRSRRVALYRWWSGRSERARHERQVTRRSASRAVRSGCGRAPSHSARSGVVRQPSTLASWWDRRAPCCTSRRRPSGRFVHLLLLNKIRGSITGSSGRHAVVLRRPIHLPRRIDTAAQGQQNERTSNDGGAGELIFRLWFHGILSRCITIAVDVLAMWLTCERKPPWTTLSQPSLPCLGSQGRAGPTSIWRCSSWKLRC
jgi:hypothetical protein